MELQQAVFGNTSPARIKVIGVGGGGCNAVNRMIEQGLQGVEFIAVNTDAQALSSSQTQNRVPIGNGSTRGLGAGGVPETGRKAAEESEGALIRMVDGADMVFVAAGMGGGTGTGAASVVARLARMVGALTIGIVTLPFTFEGKRRAANAEWGIGLLKDQVDTLIVIPNDRLLQVVDPRATLNAAFRAADDVLYQGIQAISELITRPGLINLDFADVRTIMQGGGAALMSIGVGKGEERARQAAENAISNPLLDVTIHGAQGVLLNIMAGADVTLYEVNEAASIVREVAHPDANVIFGAVIDPELKDEMRISIIATGFARATVASENEPAAQAAPQPIPVRLTPAPARPIPTRRVDAIQQAYSQQAWSAPAVENLITAEQQQERSLQREIPSHREAAAQPPTQPAHRSDEFSPRYVNTDDLDVPTFLRNRIRARSK